MQQEVLKDAAIIHVQIGVWSCDRTHTSVYLGCVPFIHVQAPLILIKRRWWHVIKKDTKHAALLHSPPLMVPFQFRTPIRCSIWYMPGFLCIVHSAQCIWHALRKEAKILVSATCLPHTRWTPEKRSPGAHVEGQLVDISSHRSRDLVNAEIWRREEFQGSVSHEI